MQIIDRENGKKTFETLGRDITFESKLYCMRIGMGLARLHIRLALTICLSNATEAWSNKD